MNQHIRKNLFNLLVMLILMVASMLLCSSRLKNDIAKHHDDEIHTIAVGVHSLYSKEVDLLRVGESTRWLARILYPVGIYYMNSNMGGEHFLTGWNYPGGFYLKQYLNNTESIKSDPNIQDFIYSMRMSLAALVVLSFFWVSLILSNKYNLVIGLFYFVFSTTSTLVVSALDFFYTESTLIIVFNIIAGMSLLNIEGKIRLYMWLSFLMAFAISTKLSGILFLFPIAALIVINDKNFSRGVRVELFFLATMLFYLIINIFASSYMSLFDQMSSNIYHLKTGHYDSQPSGLFQLSIILDKLNVLVYLFPIAVILHMLNIKNDYSRFSLAVGLACLLIIFSMIDVAYSLTRNLTIVYVMMTWVLSGLIIMLPDVKFIAASSFFGRCKKWIGIVFALIILIFYNLKYFENKPPFDRMGILNSLSTCSSIGSVDPDFEINLPNTKVPSMPVSFNMTNDIGWLKDQFLGYDCVFVKRIGNNKHYTNYILLKDFKLEKRIDNYFIFKK